MGKILELRAGKETILIESADLSLSKSKLRQAGGLEKINKNLDDVLKVIEPISKSILKNFEKLTTKPNTASAEFGLSLTFEGNLLVVKASGSGKS